MKSKKKISSWLSTIILISIFLIGICVMLYPIVSDYINTKHQSYAIAKYDEAMNNLEEKNYNEIFSLAEDYNRRLKKEEYPLSDYEKVSGYEQVLDITGTGIMGYITIPQIQIQLPVYHGTSTEVLNIAIGHLQGSTLPIGGDTTHAVLSAHRGLPSAKLFSDLDKLVVGDTFMITVLNKVLTYEVDKISIVEPHEINYLEIETGKDYVTLLTCTPYGVNTHRLLVRGKRIENKAPEFMVRVSSDAIQIEPLVVCIFGATPLMILLFITMLAGYSIKNKKNTIRKDRRNKKNRKRRIKNTKFSTVNWKNSEAGEKSGKK